MLGTVTFGKGQWLQTYNVMVIEARFQDHADDGVATVRVRLDRPYEGRWSVTLPEDCVDWTGGKAPAEPKP